MTPKQPEVPTVFAILFCGTVLFFLDAILQVTSALELMIMKTPVLKQIYYFLMT